MFNIAFICVCCLFVLLFCFELFVGFVMLSFCLMFVSLFMFVCNCFVCWCVCLCLCVVFVLCLIAVLFDVVYVLVACVGSRFVVCVCCCAFVLWFELHVCACFVCAVACLAALFVV